MNSAIQKVKREMIFILFFIPYRPLAAPPPPLIGQKPLKKMKIDCRWPLKGPQSCMKIIDGTII